MPKLNISNHAGSYSLYETVRVLDRASVLLTNDTGVMHMAAARRVPVVAVFGSTVQQFGFAPFRVRHEVVEAARELVPCRPCTHIGRARCPKLSAKKHFLCMTGIAPERVAEAALRLIGFET
jgi:heptosyltransferase-2